MSRTDWGNASYLSDCLGFVGQKLKQYILLFNAGLLIMCEWLINLNRKSNSLIRESQAIEKLNDLYLNKYQEQQNTPKLKALAFSVGIYCTHVNDFESKIILCFLFLLELTIPCKSFVVKHQTT